MRNQYVHVEKSFKRIIQYLANYFHILVDDTTKISESEQQNRIYQQNKEISQPY